MQLPSLEIIKMGIADLVIGPKVRLHYFPRSPPAVFLSGLPRGKMMETFHIRILKNATIQTSGTRREIARCFV